MNMHLSMVILVKNEEAIIGENIRFHQQQGVDSFFVMDNNSEDGTLDLLQQLSNDVDLTIIPQPANNYDQRNWMSSLIRLAKAERSANWVIPNDADEFWVPTEQKSLKDCLKRNDSVVTCQRKNMIVSDDLERQHKGYYKAQYRVAQTIKYRRESEETNANISLLFADIQGKVIVNPSGFRRISGGNHRAKHWRKIFTGRESADILVHHFPYTSWPKFKLKVEIMAELLKQQPPVRMGNHCRRWARMLKNGTLDEEYNKLFPSQQHIRFLQEWGLAEPCEKFL